MRFVIFNHLVMPGMKFLCSGFMELVSLYYHLHLATFCTAFFQVLVFACTLIWNFCSKMLKKFPGESNNAKLFSFFN